MIWLLKFIVFGHVHKWKETGRFPLQYTNAPGTGTRVLTVCEKCGAHRKWDLI